MLHLIKKYKFCHFHLYEYECLDQVQVDDGVEVLGAAVGVDGANNIWVYSPNNDIPNKYRSEKKIIPTYLTK